MAVIGSPSHVPRHEDRIKSYAAQWVVQALVRTYGTYAVVMGAFICEQRAYDWGDPRLQVALQVPGAPPTWGVILVLIGVLIIVTTFIHRMRLVSLGLFLLAVWSLTFDSTVLVSVLQHDRAHLSMVVFTHGFIAVSAAFLAAAYRQSA